MFCVGRQNAIINNFGLEYLMKDGLRIAFFGSSLVSAYWNGAATYYRGIIKELYNNGHSVTFYEPDIYDRQKFRDVNSFGYAKSVVYAPRISEVKSALKSAEDSDVIIKTSGIGIFDEFLESAVLELKTSDKKIIFWDVDAPVTLDRIRGNPEDPFIKLIPQFDGVFTYGGGNPVVNLYRKFGANLCLPIYNALDPVTHYPENTNARFEGTLGFMGNRLPDREKRVSEFFFEAARLAPEKKFVLGGNGWENSIPELKNVYRVGHVFTYEHNSFNCSTLVTLNINRQSMVDYGYSPPTRIFEAAGAGACIICDRWEGIENFLSPGKECLVASCGKEVAELVSNLTSAEAKKIGRAAFERIVSEHTYSHRADAIEGVLSTD
jgi:spore maturation protein CgeB